jgi:acetyl-CoA C-acetyltransferase
LAANRYFHQYGLSPEEGKETLARIAVKNHHNGSLNPKAHFQREITIEQAMKAPMIAYPLGVFDCCGVSDGAAAAVITNADLAKKFRDDYVLVKSIQLVTGA